MAAYGKPDARGRSSGKLPKRMTRHIDPPAKGEGRWVWLTEELLCSPAFLVLSNNARKVMFRLITEHSAHGRFENGNLCVSFRQFSEQCGVRYQSVGKAIRELEAVGLIKVCRSGKILGRDEPNVYTLTFYGTFSGDFTHSQPATHDWKRYKAQIEAENRIQSFENAYLRRTGKMRKQMPPRENSLPENVTALRVTRPESK